MTFTVFIPYWIALLLSVFFGTAVILLAIFGAWVLWNLKDMKLWK